MDANEIFSNNLKFYVIKSGRTQSQIAADLSVSKGTFSDWISGRSHPRMNKVQQIADYFGISKSDLLEDGDRGLSGEVAAIIRQIDMNPLLKKLLGIAAALDDDDLELAIKFLNRLDGK